MSQSIDDLARSELRAIAARPPMVAVRVGVRGGKEQRAPRWPHVARWGW